MDFENHPPPQLTAAAAAQFQEGILLVLSRWTSLQMAVAEEWGGPTSRKKSEDLAVRIFSLFAQQTTKATLYADDVEDFLDDFMISDFSAELDDGSIEEVAEKLMTMHCECAQGNFNSINDLKTANLVNSSSSVSYRRQEEVRGEEEEEDDDDDDSGSVVDDGSDMAVDYSFEQQTCMDQRETMMDEEPIADINKTEEDGWTVVSSRRRSGRKN